MRFIADEGVDKAIVEALRGVGRDVRWIAEELQGAKDDAILDAAARDARLLITEDKDFGEFVYRQRLHHRGVILVRLDGISNLEKGRVVAQTVSAHETELSGAFTVIRHTTIRIRRA